MLKFNELALRDEILQAVGDAYPRISDTCRFERQGRHRAGADRHGQNGRFCDPVFAIIKQ